MAVEIEKPGIWFGDKPAKGRDELQVIVGSLTHGERQRLLAISELLKDGSFAARRDLQVLLLESKDRAVRQFGLRLFCYVARHEDMRFFGDILKTADANDVHTLATYAPHALSPHAIPYLFAVLQDCEDEALRQDIAYSVQVLYPMQDEVDPEIEFGALRVLYANFASQLSDKAYYYGGRPAFAGDLTKSLITAASEARAQSRQLQRADEPTLLSIWSGLQCPVDYATLVDDAAFRGLMDYAKAIAAMPWERGAKYFYGHIVDK